MGNTLKSGEVAGDHGHTARGVGTGGTLPVVLWSLDVRATPILSSPMMWARTGGAKDSHGH
jgi:hypothetical protein